jgi:hypothetical protein
MGLLDDAIRDHLQLKRLRGADPGEVAREEREALDPPPTAELTEEARDSASAAGAASKGAPEHAPAGIAPGERHRPGAPEPQPRSGSPNVVEETAELDMQAALEDDREAAAGGPSPGSGGGDPAGASAKEDHPDASSLQGGPNRAPSSKPTTPAGE